MDCKVYFKFFNFVSSQAALSRYKESMSEYLSMGADRIKIDNFINIIHLNLCAKILSLKSTYVISNRDKTI